MKKTYMNHEMKQVLLQVLFLVPQAKKLTEVGLDYDEELSQAFKDTEESILKAVRLIDESMPKSMRAVRNELNYCNALIMPKDECHRHHMKYIDRATLIAKGEPLEQLYEFLDIIFPMTCKGCNKNGKDCRLCHSFTKYKIPELDENDEVCKYRY